MTEIVAGLVLIAGVAFALVVRFARADSGDSHHGFNSDAKPDGDGDSH